jgi:hypothetical protein
MCISTIITRVPSSFTGCGPSSSCRVSWIGLASAPSTIVFTAVLKSELRVLQTLSVAQSAASCSKAERTTSGSFWSPLICGG